MSEREAFEKALQEDRYDRVTRMVFADWLEEYGFDDQAVEQRRCATEEWCTAARALEEMAAQCGSTCTNYDVRWDAYIGKRAVPEPVEVEITFDTMIAAGYMASDGGGDAWCQEGSEMARNLMSHENRQEFWKNWQIVTGQVPFDPYANPFTCSC